MPATSNANRNSACRKISTLALLFLTSLAAPAQMQPPASASQTAPVFDIISIKPNKSDNGGMSMGGGPDRFTGKNLTIVDLIMTSYSVKSTELISGLPGWTHSAHFDFDAKVTDPDKQQMDNLKPEQRRAMTGAS